MRKLWYAGLVLAMGLGVAACDNSPKSKQEAAKTEPAAPAKTPKKG